MGRKRNGSDTYHFCKNCSQWPTSDYKESNSGDQCNECKSKKANGDCTPG